MKKIIFAISLMLLIYPPAAASNGEWGLGWQTTYLYADIPWDELYDKYKNDSYLLTGPVVSYKIKTNFWLSSSLLMDTLSKKSDFETKTTGSLGDYTASWKGDIDVLYMDIVLGYLYKNFSFFTGGRAFGFDSYDINYSVSSTYTKETTHIDQLFSAEFSLFSGFTYYVPAGRNTFLHASISVIYGNYTAFIPYFKESAGKVSNSGIQIYGSIFGYNISAGYTSLIFNEKLSLTLSPKYEYSNIVHERNIYQYGSLIRLPDLGSQKSYSLTFTVMFYL